MGGGTNPRRWPGREACEFQFIEPAWRIEAKTRCPRAARARAVRSPKPLLLPVIRTVRGRSVTMIVSRLRTRLR